MKNEYKESFGSKQQRLIPLFFSCLGAILAVVSGADSSFDTLNYHLYNGWATFRNVPGDWLPTSIWTYFPSHLDFLYYLLWSSLPSTALGVVVGGFQGLLGFLVYLTVGLFEDEKSKISTRGLFFGTIALGSPLAIAQFGNSMHDATLAVLEFYIVYRLLQNITTSKKIIFTSIPIVTGIVLALKPAHITFVIIAMLVMLFQTNSIRQTFRTFGIFGATFVLASIPWWYKSFAVTGTPIFPYLQFGNRSYLSNGAVLHSYKEWEIDSFSKFFKHLTFQGGHPSVNHEIPFIDFTIPIALFLAVSIFVISKWDGMKDIGKSTPLRVGYVLLGLSLAIYMLNQFIFTGIRYSIVVFPMTVCVLGIWSTTKKSNLQVLLKLSISLLVTLNLLLPNLIYVPNRDMPLLISSIPDYGRVNQSYFKPIRNGYAPIYPVGKRDTILLGQEQVSFVAPLWDEDAHFVGLQAYILGKDSRKEIESRISSTLKKGDSVYLVALSQNLATMSSQLAQVSINFRIAECKSIENPFRRDISMCRVNY